MHLRDITKELRKRQTDSEAIFWDTVRSRKLGVKFVRQYAITFDYKQRLRFFIEDFYYAEKRLVVEIDGKIHERQKDYDEMRTYIINKLDIKVVRLKNEDAKFLQK